MTQTEALELLEYHTRRIHRATVLSEQLRAGIQQWEPASITPARFAEVQQVVLEVHDAYTKHMADVSEALYRLRDWARDEADLTHSTGSVP